MKLVLDKESLKIVTEDPIDVVYVENVLGIKENRNGVLLYRNKYTKNEDNVTLIADARSNIDNVIYSIKLEIKSKAAVNVTIKDGKVIFDNATMFNKIAKELLLHFIHTNNVNIIDKPGKVEVSINIFNKDF